MKPVHDDDPQNGLTQPRRPLTRVHYAALLLPWIGLGLPWIYARWTPEIFGLPFFYAYQFGWIFVSVAIMVLIYRSTR